MLKKILIPIVILIAFIIAIIVSIFAELKVKADSSSSFDGIYGSSIQEKVWWALKDAGFSDCQVAAAMGNIEIESDGFVAERIEYGYDENTGGIGLCQWTNANRGQFGNNTNLKNFAASNGTTWKDEDIQVKFLITYLTGTGEATDFTSNAHTSRPYFGTYYKATAWEEYEETGDIDVDIDYLTRAYLANYEGPSQDSANKSINKRIEAAKKYYEQFHNAKRPSFSNGSGYWWPVGGSSIIKENGIEFAPGEPTSIDIWWNPGYRQWGGGTEWHKGTDIGNSGPGKTDYIISIGNGTVVRRTNRIDWGNGYNSDGAGLDGYGNSCKYADDLYVIYGHMKANTVRVKNGDTVKRGQVLGVMGDSGSASGIHLCFVMLKGETISQSNTIIDISKYVSTTNPRP